MTMRGLLLAIGLCLGCVAPNYAGEPLLNKPSSAPLPPVGEPRVESRALLTEPPPCDNHLAPVPAPPPFTPFMLGDFIGPVANMFSDVKIAEGESPRPMDRVFYRFNYYNNLNKARWTNPAEPINNVALYQHVLGVEKTFFTERFSLGLRVPFYTIDAQAKEFRTVPTPGQTGTMVIPGGPGFSETEFGNIAAIAKMVLLEDAPSGSLVSAGATISFPTASSQILNPGSSTLAYTQPFVGFIINQGNAFVHGFSSITLPVARAESIVWFNDVGVGYFVFRNRSVAGLLQSVAPTAELHIATPLRQADPNVDIFGLFDNLRLHDVVNVTVGSTFEFAGGATLGVGVVTPLTGPKPFDIEAIAQFNYRF